MHARKKLLHVTFMAMLPSSLLVLPSNLLMLPSNSLVLPSNLLVLPSSSLALASFSSARIAITRELLALIERKVPASKFLASNESKFLASYLVTSILLAN